MKTAFNRILFLLLFGVFSCLCAANNYYFSTSAGDDSRSFAEAQNPATPWKTIGKLNAIFSSLQPGDSVLFKRGEVFTGGIVVSKSGASGAPIVIGAFGEGEPPVINGLQTVTTWTAQGSGVFKSPPINDLTTANMVVINGVNYAMGRYPNPDAENGGYLTIESTGNSTITDEALAGSLNWVGAEVVLRNQRWILDRAPITNILGQTLTYDNSELDYGPGAGIGYFIQNDLKTLDQFGEWYFDSDTKELFVFLGIESAADQTIQVTVVDLLVDLQASHIVLENLVLSGANQYAVFNLTNTVENLQISNCDIAFSGIDAIHLESGKNINISGCRITDSNNNAIFLSNGCQYSRVTNNYIANTGIHAGMGQSGDGEYIALYNRAKGLVAEYNTIVNTGYIGINFSGDSSLIKNNYINTFCSVKDDGAGIYSYIGPTNNTTIAQQVVGNIIVNGIGAPHGTTDTNYFAAEGIYLDENVNHIEVADNTIANCSNNGLFIHNARDFRIDGNTSYNNQVQVLISKDTESAPVTGGEVSGNIFFAKDPAKTVAAFKTVSDDIDDFGAFNNNYYARPFDDDFTIETEIFSGSADYLLQNLTLSQWKQTYGTDQGSRRSPVDILSYRVDSMGTINRFSNGNFNANIDGLNCWSPIDNCGVSWDSDNLLDGGALEVATDGASRLMLEFGATDNDKQYLLKFSAVAARDGQLEVFFREGSPSWNVVSSSEEIYISSEREEYEMLFSFPNNTNVSNIEFFSEIPNFTYWLDNVALYEVRASLVEPNDIIRFEYNPTTTPKTILLDTTYIDVKNLPYTGSVTIAPFESLILIQHDVISSVLPVELSRFYAVARACEHIALYWTAEVEENFSHYELQKSEDGMNFSTIYHEKPEDEASPSHYHFLDFDIKKQNYYRLKMIDFDGSINYSRIIAQPADCAEEPLHWEIYPNPVRDSAMMLNIRYYTDNKVVSLVITDHSGRVVDHWKPEAHIGWNQLTRDVTGLAPGVYYIYDANALYSKAHRFVVVR